MKVFQNDLTRSFIADSVKLKITIAGSKYLRNGIEYVKADRADVTVKIVSLKLHFDNLFNGDRVLGDLGNSLINQNIDLFLRDIEPSLQRSLCKIVVFGYRYNLNFMQSFYLVFSESILEVGQSSSRKSAIQCLLTSIDNEHSKC